MKKASVIIAILTVLFIAGCASSGGATASSPAVELQPYAIDLSTIRTRNTEPFEYQYDDFMVLLPSLNVDLTQYKKMTIRAKVYDENGTEIPSNWGNAMFSVILEDADQFVSRENEDRFRKDGHANIPLKEFNVDNTGEFGDISKDRGLNINLKANPTGILFQSSNSDVKYLEVTAIIFHNDGAGLD